MGNKDIVICSLGTLLLLSVAGGLYMHHRDSERISELVSQVGELHQKEKQSVIDRRVSNQMEEIAFGQQVLAEERSREAIHQSEIAQAATLRSEAERQNALAAQAEAEDYAHEALESYQMAERQRLEAEAQRQQAEHAKLVADTLNYISLGRTLGSMSYSNYRSGDTELGNMLAYASYLFTSAHGGDLYSSSVFQALTQSAGSGKDWSVHQGSISTIDIAPDNSHLLTVSTYGEIFSHRMQDGQLVTTPLMSDKHYCFRDAYLVKNDQAGLSGREGLGAGTSATVQNRLQFKAYAVSHTGHLVIINHGETRVLTLQGVARPFSLQSVNNDQQLLIVGNNSMALLDIATDNIIGTRQLDYLVTCTGRRDSKPLLFDNRGRMHLVSGLDDMTDEAVPTTGKTTVTAFASSKHEHLEAYGMSDGSIWLADAHGKMSKLVGHLSQVTNMKFNGRRLYSSSYDGKLLFWMIGESQAKPITLFQSTSWLTDFIFSSDKTYIWTGESNGTITQYLISLPQIAERIRKKVKRNFNQEEWNYYVGKGIPYKKIIDN